MESHDFAAVTIVSMVALILFIVYLMSSYNLC